MSTAGIEGLLLVSSGYGPEMLLNLPQCTGWPPFTPTNMYLALNASSTEGKKPGVERRCYSESNEGMRSYASNSFMGGRAFEMPLKAVFEPLLQQRVLRGRINEPGSLVGRCVRLKRGHKKVLLFNHLFLPHH